MTNKMLCCYRFGLKRRVGERGRIINGKDVSLMQEAVHEKGTVKGMGKRDKEPECKGI